MKRNLIKTKSQIGMTLVELVLAMGMMSILAAGGGGVLSTMAKIESRQVTQSRVQADLNMAFRRFENDITSYAANFKPYFRIYYKPTAQPAVDLVNFVPETNAVTQFDIGTKRPSGLIEIRYSYYIIFRNVTYTVNGANTVEREYWLVRKDNVAQPAVYELLVGGFTPHAVLRNYDGFLGIDSNDIIRRNDCLNNLASCVAPQGVGDVAPCPVKGPSDRHLFSPDSLGEAGSKFERCYNRSVLPFIEFSPDQQIISLSMKTFRRNLQTGRVDAKTMENTKTVFVHRGIDD